MRCNDVKLVSGHLELHIRSSKTDQFRKGDSVLIARSEECTCPVGMLEQYITRAEIDLSSELHLFRGISHTKKGEKLRVTSISYTRLREIVKTKLEEIGVDGGKYGLHSFRAGELWQLPTTVFQIDFLNSTEDGNLRLLRTGMCWIHRRRGFKSLAAWAFGKRLCPPLLPWCCVLFIL